MYCFQVSIILPVKKVQRFRVAKNIMQSTTLQKEISIMLLGSKFFHASVYTSFNVTWGNEKKKLQKRKLFARDVSVGMIKRKL